MPSVNLSETLVASPTADPVSTFEKIKYFSLNSILGTILYFTALHATRAAAIIPATPIDHLIPFVPWFVVFYFSLFPFLPFTLVAIRDYREFIPATVGFFLIITISNTIFLIWPTMIPAGAPYDPLLHGLFVVDRERNACPSLHASLALYTALVIERNIHSRKLISAAVWIWALLIIASPLLTKRHMVIDIVCGLLFAAIIHFSMPRLCAPLTRRLRS